MSWESYIKKVVIIGNTTLYFPIFVFHDTFVASRKGLNIFFDEVSIGLHFQIESTVCTTNVAQGG